MTSAGSRPHHEKGLDVPLPDRDVSVGHSFGLEVDGVTISGITEISGLAMEQDVIELKENGPDGDVVRRLPGRPKAGEVTLTRGLTADASFEKWVKDSRLGVLRGDDVRLSGAIVVFDHEGNALKRYRLTNAWPKKLEIATLKAGDINVLTERLTVTYEEMEPE